MKEATFIIPGKPATAGSKRGIPFKKRGGGLGVRMLHDNARFASWRQEAAWCAKQTGIWFDGPVTLSVIWVRPRPKSHYRTGKHSANLRLDVPLAPGTKPDLCKVVRALEDSLTGTLWRDDSQVVQHQTAKIYSWHGAEECLRVRVRDWCINDLSSIDMGDEL